MIPSSMAVTITLAGLLLLALGPANSQVVDSVHGHSVKIPSTNGSADVASAEQRQSLWQRDRPGVCPDVCPACPTLPSCPACPDHPGCPACPDHPGCPACPDHPGCPACPDHPGCPEIPPCPVCPSPPACPVHIPPGYRYHENLGYYKMHYEMLSWNDAKAACEREGGYLVVLNSQREADLASRFMSQHGFTDYMHIGFLDVTKSRNYITVLDRPLSSTGYETWAPGEPSEVGVENCGSIRPNYGLNDIRCEGSLKRFLCELFD